MEAPRGVEPTGTNGRKATLIFPDPFGDRIILLQTIPYGNEHGMNTRRNINGNRVPYPVPRPPQAGRPQRLTVQEKICGGHGPGETPGPIPNPEAKAWHGDGTAPDRVWESSTPPHHTYRKPLGAHAPRGFSYTRNTHDPNPHTPTKTPGASRMPGHKQDTSGTHTATGPPHTRGTTTDLCCDAWIGPAVLNVLMPFGRWSCQGKRYGNRIATRRLIGARLASR